MSIPKKPKHISNSDRIIANNIKLTNEFINNNKQLSITNADKGNLTVISDKPKYLEKANIMFYDIRIY